MDNVILGILTTLACSIGYYSAWKYYSRDQFVRALTLIIASGLALRLFISTDFFLHVWDERYHALVAKNLMAHPLKPMLYDRPLLSYDYQNWVGNHVWLHKQPLPLWLMAASMKVFGVNEIAMRLPSILMSTVGIYLTYRIAGFFFDQRTGLLSAFLFSINGLVLELTAGRVATDHIDIAFMFFILLAVFFCTKSSRRNSFKNSILIGICIGSAVLCKWLTGLIVIPIWLLIVAHRLKSDWKMITGNLLLIMLAVTMVALPWQLYIFQAFPLEAGYETSFNLRHFNEVIEERSGSALYFINRIRINYGELIYLPMIWLLFQIFKKPRYYSGIALGLWILIPLAVFSFASTKMQGYLLFTAPAMLTISAAFFFSLKDRGRVFGKKWLSTVILILLIVLPVRYSLERLKPFEQRERSPEWVEELKSMSPKETEHLVLFNYEDPIEAMFYTNMVAYAKIPTRAEIELLIDQGYSVVLNEGNIPNDIRSIEGVSFVDFESSSSN